MRMRFRKTVQIFAEAGVVIGAPTAMVKNYSYYITGATIELTSNIAQTCICRLRN